MNEAAGLPENNAPASRERLPARAGRLIWQALRIATPIAVVVVPFGYAITGLHSDVLMGLGCALFGLAAGLTAIVFIPWTVLIAGLLSHRREGWRDARPPRLLVISAVVLQALVVFSALNEVLRQIPAGIPATVVAWPIAWSIAIPLAGPVAAFVVGRAATTWLKPRLRMYGQLADYLRVMWIPVGGFAVGYLTIIVVFSGFYGMLERFHPGAFADPGTGIVDWLSFAFFTALGQDFITITPVSVAARMLVGVHLILSAGWALVLFAAVMTSIRPKLDRIAQSMEDQSSE